MSQFSISIDCDNAAFNSEYEGDDTELAAMLNGEHRAREVARILRKLADRVEYGSTALGKPDCGSLLDVNGNTCGTWDLS